MKLKLISLPLLIVFIALFTLPVKACEPPSDSFWFLTRLTFDPFTVPDGIELAAIDSSWEGDHLSLTNNTNTTIYIIFDQTHADELRILHEASLKNPDETNWITQLEIIDRNGSGWKVEPAQTRNIGYNNYEWADLGGLRPVEVTIPEPITNSITLVHQEGVQTIIFVQSFVLNPDYPAVGWGGCPEEIYEEPIALPSSTPTGSKDTAVINNLSTLLLLAAAGFVLLLMVVLRIYKVRQHKN